MAQRRKFNTPVVTFDIPTANMVMSHLAPYMAPQSFGYPQLQRGPAEGYELSDTLKPKKPQNSLQLALHDFALMLKEILYDAPNVELMWAGLGVYREVQRLSRSKDCEIPKHKLADILNITRTLVQGEEEPSASYRKEMDIYHDLANDIRHFPWGKIIAGAMLCLLGAAIIVASGILACLSFGLLAPLDFLGLYLGHSLLIGSAAIVTGGTCGLGSVIGGSLLFFKAGQKNPLLREMETVELEVRRVHG